jgi:t-SNARE complex subunit (syntaxin)
MSWFDFLFGSPVSDAIVSDSSNIGSSVSDVILETQNQKPLTTEQEQQKKEEERKLTSKKILGIIITIIIIVVILFIIYKAYIKFIK